MIFLTGGAGFIGRCIASKLINRGVDVLVFDNLSSGRIEFLPSTRTTSGKISFFQGDIRSCEDLSSAIDGCSAVIHLAAMVSVPKSLANPMECHEVNVTGFQNVVEAARKAGIQRLVYSSSSAVYGRQRELPIKEEVAGKALSPYGGSKLVNETNATTYSEAYGFQSIGLRYFNVFGPGQNPEGDYAAVIPKWINAILTGKSVAIYGDGSSVRDFIFVDDVAEFNISAALSSEHGAFSKIVNIGSGRAFSLLNLFDLLKTTAKRARPELDIPEPNFFPARIGDIPASVADVSRMKNFFGEVVLSDFDAAIWKTFFSFL